jgi:enterobactin synthetase component D
MELRTRFCAVDGADDWASPEERSLAARYTGPRRDQFLAGRRAARALAGEPVLAEPDGLPVFPPGWTGSIAHTARMAVAAIAPAGRFDIGVDIEDLAPERPAIVDLVLSDSEPVPGDWASLLRVFCLKEALYKALYPSLRRFVDFKEVSVRAAGDGPAAFELHLDCGRQFVCDGGSRRIEDRMFAWARVWR